MTRVPETIHYNYTYTFVANKTINSVTATFRTVLSSPKEMFFLRTAAEDISRRQANVVTRPECRCHQWHMLCHAVLAIRT